MQLDDMAEEKRILQLDRESESGESENRSKE